VKLLQDAGYKIDYLADLDDAAYDKATQQFGDSHPHLCRRMKYVLASLCPMAHGWALTPRLVPLLSRQVYF